MTMRPLSRADLPQLSAWLAAPHVALWWRESSDPAAVEATYGPAIDGDDPTELLAVELEGRPVGMLQRYLLADNPEYERALAVAGAAPAAASIDYLIGEQSLTGQGLGTLMIAQASRELWRRHPGLTAVVVAVQQENRPSWRALEKAGYSRVWAGLIESGDPSDDGPSYVYRLDRPPDGRQPVTRY